MISSLRSFSSSGLFADYPQMGVDRNAIYIGTNDFKSAFFSNTSAFVIRKSSVTGSSASVDASTKPTTAALA